MKRKPEHPQEPMQHKTQGAGMTHISRNIFTTDILKLPKPFKNSQTKTDT